MENKELETNFYHYVRKNQLGRTRINPNENISYYVLTQSEIQSLADKSLVFDARHGGLVLGKKSNYKGGIYFIYPYYEPGDKEQRYFYAGELVPGSYITNSRSFKIYQEEYSKMQNCLDNFLSSESLPEIPANCKIINTGNLTHSFVIVDDKPRMIFSNTAVKVHLEKIVSMDR